MIKKLFLIIILTFVLIPLASANEDFSQMNPTVKVRSYKKLFTDQIMNPGQICSPGNWGKIPAGIHLRLQLSRLTCAGWNCIHGSILFQHGAGLLPHLIQILSKFTTHTLNGLSVIKMARQCH